jgi:hypothetical protein
MRETVQESGRGPAQRLFLPTSLPAYYGWLKGTGSDIMKPFIMVRLLELNDTSTYHLSWPSTTRKPRLSRNQVKVEVCFLVISSH